MSVDFLAARSITGSGQECREKRECRASAGGLDHEHGRKNDRRAVAREGLDHDLSTIVLVFFEDCLK
ncbi:hypothetical protein LV564_07655 [Komagataeibacter nataicola]|uniref:hypothetical protein n=1 Tax=Komagataeibacter nataicola TaxID=265960 RepID=UPI0011B78C09|nr:hypothetical protein [Komagataeibacter nataicola]WEQ56925.1 hypothetical protein LV564_07655 [Komagataeibacter nataicola]